LLILLQLVGKDPFRLARSAVVTIVVGAAKEGCILRCVVLRIPVDVRELPSLFPIVSIQTETENASPPAFHQHVGLHFVRERFAWHRC